MKLLLLLFFLSPVATFSQETILQVIDTAVQKEFYLYDVKARDNFFKSPDSTIYYGEKFAVLANQGNNLIAKIEAQNLIGCGQYLKGYYVDAITTFLSILKIVERAKETKLKTSGLMEIYDGLGCTYCEAGFFEEGIPYLYKANNLALVLNDTSGLLNETGSIGMYYEKNNQLDSAEYYLTKGLSMSDAYSIDFYRPSLLYSLGDCKMKKGQINNAVEIWKKVITYVGIDNLSAGKAYKDLGKFYLEKGYYDSSY
ncbi:MAG: hypothetical protein ABI863_21530, partial [Ginsengibacter sp.]